MRITESQLRKIVRQEVMREAGDFDGATGMPLTARGIKGMQEPGHLSPHETLERIRNLVDEALMNKSFGFSRRITEKVVDDLSRMIDDLRRGGQDGYGR